MVRYYKTPSKTKSSDEKTKIKNRRSLMVDNAKAPPYHEIIRILGACKNDKERMMIKVGWNMALRVSEIVGIRVLDFDLSVVSSKLIVPARIAKMGSGGTVKIYSESFRFDLLEYIEKNGLERFDYIFNYTKERKPYTSRHIIRVFNNIGKRAYSGEVFQREIVNEKRGHYRNVFHPHMLRHSRARYLIQNGIEPDAVKSFLRHSDVQTTFSFYGNFFDEENFKQLENLPAPEGL
jgi:integrase